ncbi:MAG: glycosyltransferase [Candidatus Woesearchaeota archaeon]
MKIAILTPTFSAFSGPDRVAWNEADELSENNEVSVFCFKADMNHPKAGVFEFGAPKNKTLERIYKIFFFMDVPKVEKIAKMLKGYDWIICFLYPMTIPAWLAKKRYGKHYTYYDVGLAYPKLFRGFAERTAMKLINFFTKITVKNADDAISISRFLSNELKKETGLRSRVKYVKIDRSRFNLNVDEKKTEAVRKKYGLGKPTLLYVGRISPHKGIHLLIRAFNIVRRKFPKAKLLVIGKHTFDSYSKELEKLDNGGVIFTGFIPDEDLPHYYNACDLYVTASLWEGFNMPICLTPDSKIKTDQGFKDIISLQIGEKVTTHKGNEREINSATKRHYAGNLLNISVYGCNSPLRITPEHRVYAIRTKRCKTNKICKPDCPCKKRHYASYKPEWIEAKDLEKGYALIYPYGNYNHNGRSNFLKISDYVTGIEMKGGRVYYKYSRLAEKGKDTYEKLGRSMGMSKNAIYRYLNKTSELSAETCRKIGDQLKAMAYELRKKLSLPNKIRINRKFMRLAGYYLSEGCSPTSKTTLCFSFNSKETAYQNDVLYLMEKIFGISGSKEINGNGCRITYSSQILNMFFSSLFGKGAKNKHIDSKLMCRPKKEAIELLKGLWRGDGTIYADKNENTIVSYSTSSPKLAEQLKDLLLSVGAISNIKTNRRRGKEEYTLDITGEQKKYFCALMGAVCRGNRERSSHNHYWLDKKHLYAMIRKISKERYNGDVYNLHVKADNTYVTMQGAVHNCEAQAVGKKVVAFDVGSHPEVVKNGILVKEGDVKAFADAVLRLIK